jgi:hypothetical protein
MSGSAISRNYRREAHRRAVNLVYEFLLAPPQRASGDVCFLLTIDLMDVRYSSIGPDALRPVAATFRVARQRGATRKQCCFRIQGFTRDTFRNSSFSIRLLNPWRVPTAIRDRLVGPIHPQE